MSGQVLPFARPPAGDNKHEDYRLDPTFEAELVVAVCHRRGLWVRLGRHLDPTALALPAAKLALEATRAIVNELGFSPNKFPLVLQQLSRWQDEGKITYDARMAVNDLVEDAGLAALMRGNDIRNPIEEIADDDFVAQMKPLLQRRLHKEAARAAVKELAVHGDMATVTSILDRARTIGDRAAEVETLSASKDSFPAMRERRLAKRLSTAVPELDDMLDGGPLQGTLSVVLGAAGAGKSMLLIQAAVAAALQGRPVVYCTAELDRVTVCARILANLLAVPVNELLYGSLINVCEKHIDTLLADGLDFPIEVVWVEPKVATVRDVVRVVEEVEQRRGHAVSTVVVDYADKLCAGKTHKDDKGYLAAGEVYEALRLYANETQRWLWTASQATRDGTRKRTKLGINDGADSQEKVRVADLFLTLNPTDPKVEQIEIFIAKNRHGVSNRSTEPLPTDFACARIVPVDPTSYPEPLPPQRSR